MQITKEIVQKTAHLARLQFTVDDEKTMKDDLQKVVDWVDKLKEVDTNDIEPLTNMSNEVNKFRLDEVMEHISTQRALKNAPVKDAKFFRVPKVIK